MQRERQTDIGLHIDSQTDRQIHRGVHQNSTLALQKASVTHLSRLHGPSYECMVSIFSEYCLSVSGEDFAWLQWVFYSCLILMRQHSLCCSAVAARFT